jgi:hypothetical protein
VIKKLRNQPYAPKWSKVRKEKKDELLFGMGAALT